MTRPSIAGQAWQWLERELERWSSDGRRALFWWRDDDASRAENRLDRLLKLADKHALPLAIAAIPARLDDSLAGRLRDTRPGAGRRSTRRWPHAGPPATCCIHTRNR